MAELYMIIALTNTKSSHQAEQTHFGFSLNRTVYLPAFERIHFAKSIVDCPMKTSPVAAEAEPLDEEEEDVEAVACCCGWRLPPNTFLVR